MNVTSIYAEIQIKCNARTLSQQGSCPYSERDGKRCMCGNKKARNSEIISCLS